jgi:hypothetical protein
MSKITIISGSTDTNSSLGEIANSTQPEHVKKNPTPDNLLAKLVQKKTQYPASANMNGLGIPAEQMGSNITKDDLTKNPEKVIYEEQKKALKQCAKKDQSVPNTKFKTPFIPKLQ